jgi:hypothetical protein
MEGEAVPYENEDLAAYLAYGSQTEGELHFANAILFRRMFFTTDSGHMGMGSPNMQIGDEICVLFGGTILFILRPVGEYYKLVGECYVHGLMQGEAMEQWRAGEFHDQWFELR